MAKQAIISAGKLRNRVAIERITSEARDDRGGVVPTWSVLAFVWCSIGPLNSGSGEHFEADTQESETASLVMMRHRDITNKDRIKRADGSILNIANVLPAEKPGGYTMVHCKEPTTDG